ncbi:recombinase family protein [Paenibacillus alkaliterrae]|uniref:recombinase family protein n=1 Tax=Paenibacillus alkaliterrae TaxID=320909 RepID=UPI001F40C073|nr:recombinase family protein [Paenibacillus alkaliterrae]MCF2939931.1 recombinase family protein [Paenibacillus alkaliterrae]
MNRAALYCRVSTEEQAKYGFSIDAQLEALRSYCSTNRLHVYKTYVDAGVSGKSIQGRNQLKMMLEDAKLGSFQHVIIWRLSRLSRSLPDLLEIVDLLSNHSVALISLTEQFDTHTTLGRFTLQMMGAAAQLERDQIVENASLGAVHKAKQGKWNCGNNVLGYRWTRNPQTGDSCVEIVPKEAELVLRIFELYATGDYGYKAITNRLNMEGHRTKRGYLFSVPAVRGILTNQNYIAKVRFDVSKNRKDSSKHAVGWAKGDHDPIVRADLWIQVQLVLSQRSRPPRRLIQRLYPLTGLLKCPQCGQGMIPMHTKALRKNGSIKMNHYYACGNYLARGIAACKPNYVRADKIEEWLFNLLQAIVSSSQIVKRITTSIHAKQSATSSPLLEHANRLQIELTLLEAERKQLFQTYEDGAITKEELRNLIGSIQIHLQELQTMKDNVEQQIRATKTEAINPAHIQSAIQQIRAVLQSANADMQRQFLRLFIDKITLPPNRCIQEARLYGSGPIGHIDVTNLLQEEWRA